MNYIIAPMADECDFRLQSRFRNVAATDKPPAGGSEFLIEPDLVIRESTGPAKRG